MLERIQILEDTIENIMSDEDGCVIPLYSRREFNYASYQKIKLAIEEYIDLVHGDTTLNRKTIAYIVELEQALSNHVFLNKSFPDSHKIPKLDEAQGEISELLDRLLWDNLPTD